MVTKQSQEPQTQTKGNFLQYLSIQSLIFITIGVAAAIFFGKRVTLQCDRIQPDQVACELTATSILGTQSTAIPQGQLKGAEVQKSSRVNTSSNSKTYRIVLVTQTGRIPMTRAYTLGKKGKQDKANQIDAFLRNPAQKSLTVRQDNRWTAYILGGAFVLAGSSRLLLALRTKLLG